MRQVKDRGGPTPSYQHDVETGTKVNPQPDAIAKWVNALGVTERFVRGEIPAHSDDPAKCRALAADVARQIRSDPSLRSVGALARSRKVLRTICEESRDLKKVVVAYILGVELATLDDMLLGTIPIKQAQMKILADLTGLPEEFFRYGFFLEDYLPLALEMKGLGVTLDQAIRIIREASGQPARPHDEGEGGQESRSGEL